MHHLAQVFMLINSNEQLNIFSSLSREERQKVRKMIISMVLSTDMSTHFVHLNQLKNRLSAEDFDAAGVDKQDAMNHVIHSSDISNCFKPWALSQKWSLMVMEEFFL